ncbi:MFS transporter [Actinomycetaceae bacterium L2_0104]
MPDHNEALTGAARQRILVVLLSALFLSLITVSSVNVALPSIQQGIGASSTELQWVLSGYSLAYGVVLVAAGRAGDLLGRSRLFLVGVTVFMLASIVAALAPTALVLNLARAVMGIGAGMYSPQVSGLIQQHYQGAERARAFGMFGAVVGSAVAIGPVIGGLVLGALPPDLGWRMTLGINVPFALTAVILGYLWLPRPPRGQRETDAPRQRQDLDPIGALLLGAAIFLVMLPFMIASDNVAAWWFLPAGLIVLLGWLAWERGYRARGRSPMVDLSMFRIRTFSMGAAMITVFFAGSTTIWVLIALFAQNGMGESALVSGLLGLPAALVSIYSAPLAGRLVVRWGRKIVIYGLILNLIGLGLTAWVSVLIADGASIWLLSLSTLPIGFGGGWITSPNQALTLRDVPVANGGTAAGVMQTGQRIATAVGTAAVTGIFFHQLPKGYASALDAGYLLIGFFVVVALIIALVDAAKDRR